MTWRTSSHSSTNGGECVEVAWDAESPLVRDTKNRAGGALRMSPQEWSALLAEVKAGRLDPR